MALGKNAFLLSNECVEDKPDHFIKESEMKSEQNHRLQKIEKEVADLKSSVSEIKNVMSQNIIADPSHTEILHTAIKSTTAKENLDRVRIRGITESKNDDARYGQEHDFEMKF